MQRDVVEPVALVAPREQAGDAADADRAECHGRREPWRAALDDRDDDGASGEL